MIVINVFYNCTSVFPDITGVFIRKACSSQ